MSLYLPSLKKKNVWKLPQNRANNSTKQLNQKEEHRKYKSNIEQTNIPQKTKLKNCLGRILIEKGRTFLKVQRRFNISPDFT